jgi:hypothetical protein
MNEKIEEYINGNRFEFIITLGAKDCIANYNYTKDKKLINGEILSVYKLGIMHGGGQAVKIPYTEFIIPKKGLGKKDNKLTHTQFEKVHEAKKQIEKPKYLDIKPRLKEHKEEEKKRNLMLWTKEYKDKKDKEKAEQDALEKHNKTIDNEISKNNTKIKNLIKARDEAKTEKTKNNKNDEIKKIENENKNLLKNKK